MSVKITKSPAGDAQMLSDRNLREVSWQASSPETDPAVLAEITDQMLEIYINPHKVYPSTLVQNIIVQLASNPRTPGDTLVRLYREGKIWGEPDMDTLSSVGRVQMRRHQGQSYFLQGKVRDAIAENENTPQWLLRSIYDFCKYAKDQDNPGLKESSRELRFSLAQNTNLPGDMYRELAEDEHGDVRLRIATNRSVSGEILLLLVGDNDAAVTFGVAGHPHLSDEGARSLLKAPSFVRNTLAYRSDLPLDVILQLAGDDDPVVAYALASAEELPEEAFRVLYARPDLSDDPKLMEKIVENTSAPQWMRDILQLSL